MVISRVTLYLRKGKVIFLQQEKIMANKYRILLPKTKFPLRVKNPIKNESFIRETAKWSQLYKWQQEDRAHSDNFVLHDGPPYANGAPHMGHALNKILKDIINRYKLLRGYRIEYRPGWDCHGLPIELKACRDGDFVSKSAIEIRSKASQFAETTLNQQKEAYRNWGCIGDWDNPYTTMAKEYEANQISVFYEMYKKGCIYQGFKPVFWSPSSRTALAEAELEYKDHKSTSVYTLFPLTTRGSLDFGGSGEISALVWTTTPWTLVSNRAICYRPNHSYSLVEIKTGTSNYTVLIGSKCLERLNCVLGEYKVVGNILGSQLEGIQYRNPTGQGSDSLPFLPAFHVSDEEGTGLVHTAPSHGFEDYSIGLQYGLDLECLVDSEGKYSKEAGEDLKGLYVLDEGNKSILEKLKSLGVLVSETLYNHRYPYDWRTKKPVIIRATKQWFADVSSLKELAENSLVNNVTMYPSSSRNRLLSMLKSREDWCISRQRVWGVPIPVFYHKDTGDPLVTEETISQIKGLIRSEGSNCWWSLPVDELLPSSLQSVAQDYVIGKDTMDVWFDSGSSWATVLKDTHGTADMYLEGSDQHRGWFQSSLLTSIAVQGKAPYKSIVTHGFILDQTGNKMSKSLGNVTSPDDILTKMNYGVDVMRLWASSSDFFHDVQLSDLILRQCSDNLQKMRNTCRFMLGNISDYDPSKDKVPYSQLSKLDRYLLHLLGEYNNSALAAYDSLNFSRLCSTLESFIRNTLSSFYFDIVKDHLYCEAEASDKRRSIQTVLYHILQTFVKSIAPLVPHLAEEVAHCGLMKGL